MQLYIRRIVILATLGAILIIAQVSLAVLPNIEIVSLLIVVFSLTLGRYVFAPIAVFVVVEGLIYGFGLWWAHYIYVWPILACAALVLKPYAGRGLFVIVNGAFGLLFGGLCAIVYLFIGGPSSALAYWLSGIPFDILHGVGNVVVTWLLFKPLHRLCERLFGEIFLQAPKNTTAPQELE